MVKISLFFLSFFLMSCSSPKPLIIKDLSSFDQMSFDVVQKQLVVNENIPADLKDMLSNWFDVKVKVNGLEGDLNFKIFNYEEKISDINNGKRIELFIQFDLVVEKKSFNYKKFIKGNVNAYSQLTGTYSLNDLDNLLYNTKIDLIRRLSRDLKSKI